MAVYKCHEVGASLAESDAESQLPSHGSMELTDGPAHCESEWNGFLAEGNGLMRLESGAFEGGYSFKSRFENVQGTNPEELIAAAHAGCFSMAFALMLRQSLVRGLSAKVREDAVLGPIFKARMYDWELHQQRMCAFWSSVSGRHHGSPMTKHLPLPVAAGHFDR